MKYWQFMYFLIIGIMLARGGNNLKDRVSKLEKSCTSQIAQIQRSLEKLEVRVQSNEDVLVSHDTHLVDAGYPTCYKRVVVDDAVYYDSYGIDEMPIVP